MEIFVENFNIKQIAESGQCFRWNEISDMYYEGIIGNEICRIKQIDNKIQLDGISKEKFEEYFDINTDYRKIEEFYKDDEIIKEAIKYGSGIRILNQDKFETLISFIISANNNIPRIKKSVEMISQKFGKKIKDSYYAFPTPIELSKATVEELRECGVGFRAPYICKTTKVILEGANLEKISMLDIKDCKKELMKFTGVGPKVADCVMLFSMHKLDAFPIDVWIKRVLEKIYFNKDMSLKELEIFSFKKFPKYGGIVQQYLFYYIRGNNLT